MAYNILVGALLPVTVKMNDDDDTLYFRNEPGRYNTEVTGFVQIERSDI